MPRGQMSFTGVICNHPEDFLKEKGEETRNLSTSHSGGSCVQRKRIPTALSATAKEGPHFILKQRAVLQWDVLPRQRIKAACLLCQPIKFRDVGNKYLKRTPFFRSHRLSESTFHSSCFPDRTSQRLQARFKQLWKINRIGSPAK